MANEERGEVEFVVEEQPYTLALSMNAICEMQTRTKKTYGQMVMDMAGLDVAAVRELLWMTLKKHHGKEFDSPQKVGSLVEKHEDGVSAAIDALNRLFELNSKKAEKYQPKKEEKNGDGPPPSAQT